MSSAIHVLDGNGFVCYRPQTERALPTVVHIAGFNEDAVSHASFALRLAAVGFQCIALTPPWSETPALNNPSPAILFDLFAEGDTLLTKVLAHLEADPYTDFAAMALTGFSMGGMFVARTLAHPKPHPFCAAAIVLGTGDWSFIPRTTLDAFPDLKAVITPTTVTAIEQLLRAQSPVATPDRFPPTPLFLLNADRDPRLPLEAAQHFYDALRPAYNRVGCAEALEFHIHQGDRHEFRRAMQREVRSWLSEHLDGAHSLA